MEINLLLAQEELFQGIHCDVWMDSKKNPYMTIQQLANALEYKSKSGIENIIMRNPYIRNKEFSSTHKLKVVEGERIVERESLVFTKDGIMEIGFLSPKPKARDFRAWSRKVLNAFMDGQLVWKDQREKIKDTGKTLRDAIKEAGYIEFYHYSNFQNLIYQSSIGFTARNLRKARGAQTKAAALDFMSTEELNAVEEREKEVITLLGLGLTRDEMKELFERKGVLFETTLQLASIV